MSGSEFDQKSIFSVNIHTGFCVARNQLQNR